MTTFRTIYFWLFKWFVSNLEPTEALPLVMVIMVQKELTDGYVKQEVVGRIFLLTRGLVVRIDIIMMIDIFQVNMTSWMVIFLR